eukprot:COSAG02_NODE_28709_length_584_cov_0.839175_1_plen_109_part_01
MVRGVTVLGVQLLLFGFFVWGRMADAELRLVKRQLAEKTREFDAVVVEWEALNEQACATEALLQRQSELLGKAMDTAPMDGPDEARKTERRAAERVQRQGEAMDVCATL